MACNANEVTIWHISSVFQYKVNATAVLREIKIVSPTFIRIQQFEGHDNERRTLILLFRRYHVTVKQGETCYSLM